MLETGNLTVGGISLSEYGGQISHAGIYNKPVRDYTMVHIPGRNGDLHIDNGSFTNVDVTYNVVFPNNGESFPERYNGFLNRIMSKTGYLRIEDSFDTDHYRMGVLSATVEGKASSRDIGSCKLTFNCKPQRFLKSGDEPVSASLGERYWTQKLVSNPTFTSLSDYNMGGWHHVYSNGIQLLVTTGGAGTLVFRFYRNDGYYAEETVVFEGAETERPVIVSEENEYVDDSPLYSEEKAMANRSSFNGYFQISIDPDIVTVGYSTSGSADQFYARVAAASFNNPTRFASKPIYQVVGYGDIKVGDKIVTIDGTDSLAVTLDAETKNATYTTTGAPANGSVTGEIPDLPPGDVGLLGAHTIESIVITPRWYEI